MAVIGAQGRSPTESVVAVRGAATHAYTWHPAGASLRAVIVIAHGAGEHARRYDALARALSSAGYLVIAADALGHGRTGADAVEVVGLGTLGRGGNRAALRHLAVFCRAASTAHPGSPFVLFAHSWGSLLAQQLFARRPDLFDAVCLSGTTLALPGFVDGGDLARGFRATPGFAGVGTRGDDRLRALAWIARDRAALESILDDPYCFDIGERPVWGFRGQLELLSLPPVRGSRRFRAAGGARRVPLRIVVGGRDPLGFGGRGPRALASWYRHVTGMRDVELRTYPESRHEVFSDRDRDLAVAELLAWLERSIEVRPWNGRRKAGDRTNAW